VVWALLGVIGVKAPRGLSAVFVLAVFGGCGGSALKVGDGGSAGSATGFAGTGANAGTGGSAGAAGSSGGTTGSAGACGPGVACAPSPPCSDILDEATCKGRPDCLVQECMACGSPAFTCYASGETPPSCVEAPCPPPGGPCDMLLDEKSCAAHAGCLSETCPDCHGGQNFVGCTEPDGPTVGCGPCPPACSTLDEASCAARSDCQVQTCPSCDGGQSFVGCGEPGQGVACVATACAPPQCTGLNEMVCSVTPGCGALYCPNCNGGQDFVGCGLQREAGMCPDWPCPASAPCANVTTQAACDARTDCHSVFHTCFNCDCIPGSGCPEIFSTCADGGKAACKGTPLCNMEPPSCEANEMSAYVVSYANNCFEGCVPVSECGP
jgi:hypothetical protein